MTPAQHKRFYLPAWSACAKARGWHNQAAIWGRGDEGKRGNGDAPQPLLSLSPFHAELIASVERAAKQLATREHRGERTEDFRHACHIVALGQNKSSLELTNDECQRVVDLFRVLTAPENLTYIAHWLDPDLAKKENLITAVKAKAPEAYWLAILKDKFHTRVIEDLSVKQLGLLCFTLNERTKEWSREVAKEATPEEEFEPGPF